MQQAGGGRQTLVTIKGQQCRIKEGSTHAKGMAQAAAGRRKSMHHGASYCNIMHYDAMLMHHDAMYLPAYTL
jgi:hypothetical protein